MEFLKEQNITAEQLLEYSTKRQVVKTIELGSTEYKVTWEFYSIPNQTPSLQWDELDPERFPQNYVPMSPMLATLPHGMPWEGRLILRHPTITTEMHLLANHSKDGQGDLSPDVGIEWCMDSYLITSMFNGRLEQVRLFKTDELLNRKPEIGGGC